MKLTRSDVGAFFGMVVSAVLFGPGVGAVFGIGHLRGFGAALLFMGAVNYFWNQKP